MRQAPSATVTPKRTVTSQPVRLTAQDKVELGGTYYAPKKLREKNSAVLLVHDAGEDSTQLTDLAVAYQKRGFAVLALDLRGHGTSSSKQCDWKTSSENEREVLWAMAKRDLSIGISFLKGKREVHSSRIIVAGIGAAAGLALCQGIEDQDVAAVVLISPPTDKDKSYGFNLTEQLIDLEGLPTLILCERETRKACVAMADGAHEANEGYEFITVTPLRTDRKKLLQNRDLHRNLTTWTIKLFAASGS
ncbi:MAG: alpha/beta hydrolase [Planctomycetota bacterium]|nr:alpha/beta hydrolase [Planctomycetota bacterium]